MNVEKLTLFSTLWQMFVAIWMKNTPTNQEPSNFERFIRRQNYHRIMMVGRFWNSSNLFMVDNNLMVYESKKVERDHRGIIYHLEFDPQTATSLQEKWPAIYYAIKKQPKSLVGAIKSTVFSLMITQNIFGVIECILWRFDFTSISLDMFVFSIYNLADPNGFELLISLKELDFIRTSLTTNMNYTILLENYNHLRALMVPLNEINSMRLKDSTFQSTMVCSNRYYIQFSSEAFYDCPESLDPFQNLILTGFVDNRYIYLFGLDHILVIRQSSSKNTLFSVEKKLRYGKFPILFEISIICKSIL